MSFKIPANATKVKTSVYAHHGGQLHDDIGNASLDEDVGVQNLENYDVRLIQKKRVRKMTGPSRNFKNHQNRYESNNSQSTSEENQMNIEALSMEEAEDHIESPDDILLPERREIYRRRKRKRHFLAIGFTILALIGVIIGTTIYSVRNTGEVDNEDFDVDTASFSQTEREEKLGYLYLEIDDYNYISNATKGTSPTKN